MHIPAIFFIALSSYAAVAYAQLCWTNGLNMLMGGQPWGAGCQSSIPVAPAPKPSTPAGCPPPVTSWSTTTAWSTTTSTTTSISTTTTTETSTTTTTETSTTTVSVPGPTEYKIDPAKVGPARGICMGLNPPRQTPLFNENGDPACCVPIDGQDANGNYQRMC